TIRDASQTVEQLLDEICRTANLVLYLHPTTGLICLREIYAESTTPTLFTEEHYDDLEWETELEGDLANQVRVTYIDRSLGFKRNTVMATSDAAVERAGRLIPETLEFLM